MADLRALLGDRYVSTMRAAVLADNPEAITIADDLDRTAAMIHQHAREIRQASRASKPDGQENKR